MPETSKEGARGFHVIFFAIPVTVFLTFLGSAIGTVAGLLMRR
jgi:hypothetical protein